MSNNEKVSITLKGGGEAPWVVFHGDNPPDAVALLQGAAAQNLYAEAVSASGLFKAAYLATQPGAATAAPAAPANPYAGVPTPAAATPAPAAPVSADAQFCPHGQRTKREGNSARGPWTAYFCPLPKGATGQCEAVWG